MRRLMFVALAATAGVGALVAQVSMAEEDQLPRRAVLPLLSNDAETPTPTPTRVPPPPSADYCRPSGVGVPYPPNAILGLFTIGGEQAPAGTLITLTFDGQQGPSAYTAAAGGYRIDYAAGGQGHVPRCINEVGSELGLRVNGVAVDTGVAVGDPSANLVFRFDLALP